MSSQRSQIWNRRPKQLAQHRESTWSIVPHILRVTFIFSQGGWDFPRSGTSRGSESDESNSQGEALLHVLKPNCTRLKYVRWYQIRKAFGRGDVMNLRNVLEKKRIETKLLCLNTLFFTQVLNTLENCNCYEFGAPT